MTPASGPLRGTAGRSVFCEFLVTDPQRGQPVGGGGIHGTRWIEGIAHPSIVSEYYDF